MKKINFTLAILALLLISISCRPRQSAYRQTHTEVVQRPVAVAENVPARPTVQVSFRPEQDAGTTVAAAATARETAPTRPTTPEQTVVRGTTSVGGATIDASFRQAQPARETAPATPTVTVREEPPRQPWMSDGPAQVTTVTPTPTAPREPWMSDGPAQIVTVTPRQTAPREPWMSDGPARVTTTNQQAWMSDAPTGFAVRQETIRPLTQADAAALRRYNVVVATLSSRRNAETLQIRLQGEGNQVILAQNDRGFYRVIVGSFDNKSAAIEQRETLTRRYTAMGNTAFLMQRYGIPFNDLWIVVRQ